MRFYNFSVNIPSLCSEIQSRSRGSSYQRMVFRNHYQSTWCAITTGVPWILDLLTQMRWVMYACTTTCIYVLCNLFRYVWTLQNSVSFYIHIHTYFFYKLYISQSYFSLKTGLSINKCGCMQVKWISCVFKCNICKYNIKLQNTAG